MIHVGKVDDTWRYSGLPEVFRQIKYLKVFFKVWCQRSVAHNGQVKHGLVWVAGSEGDEI